MRQLILIRVFSIPDSLDRGQSLLVTAVARAPPAGPDWTELCRGGEAIKDRVSSGSG